MIPAKELGYYIAPPFYKQLMKSIDKVKRGNIDRLYVIDGREGEGGKSTLAMQLAYAVDPTFNLDDICFKADSFADRIRETKQYKAIIFDEAFHGLSSKGTLSKQNKLIIRLLMECRQRNLFVFIVLPSIFMLEKYVAIFRSQALIHCFASKKDIKRKYYRIYNYTNKKLLYILGKDRLSYTRPAIKNSYRFYAKLPPVIDRAVYDKKKLDAFRDLGEVEPKEDKHLKQRNFLSALLKETFNFSFRQQAKYLESKGVGVYHTKIAEGVANVTKMSRKP